MIDNLIAPKQAGGKAQFFLTGFSQAAGVRTYAFQCRVDANKLDYTVAVDLALISGYGIRIQDLPLLCRELLQQGEPGEKSAFVFTEQLMHTHADKLAAARLEADHRKHSRHLAAAAADADSSRTHLR